jgi:hypothetical protein
MGHKQARIFNTKMQRGSRRCTKKRISGRSALASDVGYRDAPGFLLREPSWFFVLFVLKTYLLAVDRAGACLREAASAKAGRRRWANQRIDQNTSAGWLGLVPAAGTGNTFSLPRRGSRVNCRTEQGWVPI